MIGRRLVPLCLVLPLLVGAVARLYGLDVYRWRDYDEGLHALQAQLLGLGQIPYRDMFFSYPPLYAWLLKWPWRLGQSVSALQLTGAGLSLLGVIAVGGLAWRLSGPLAAGIAALVLGLAPRYLVGSVELMAEVPSVAFAAVSVALAVEYASRRPESGQRWILAAAGAFVAASLLTKLMALFLPLVLAAGLIWRAWEVRRIGRPWIRSLLLDAFVAAGAFAAVCLLALLPFDLRAMWDQVIGFRLQSRLAVNDESANHLATLGEFFLKENAGLTAAALLGLVLPRRRRGAMLIAVWLLLGVVFALVQVPLRLKHLPLLLPPLAALAGVGLGETIRIAAARGRLPLRWAAGVAALCLSVLIVWQAASLWAATERGQTDPLDFYGADRLREWLLDYTAPGDCLVTDYPLLAFFSQRPVPGSTSELSYTRLRSGDLSEADLIQATEAQGCQCVAPLAHRLASTSPGYVEWVSREFLVSLPLHANRTVYLAQPLDHATPGLRLDSHFPGGPVLVGADLERAGDRLYVSLYWRADGPAEDARVLLELRDADGRVRLADSHEPFGGLLPLSRFPVGSVVKETASLNLPDAPTADSPGNVWAGLEGGTRTVSLGPAPGR